MRLGGEKGGGDGIMLADMRLWEGGGGEGMMLANMIGRKRRWRHEDMKSGHEKQGGKIVREREKLGLRRKMK
ncbi:hypothetical protein Pyn_27857 [Prunus yedoensis var. nudiflora]|uniref:Uncharacterized protein n=1 Tax=Prunus yedoensis var. nudiflora TaxID=2094558 RepID=A0A315AS87_PRUYE|nr:hypothetical protein Pyn_27857 [Prunus yedoensis var. nudiflora]